MRLSKGAIVTLLIGLVVVVLVTYFTAEIQNIIALRAWSKGAARAAAARLVEAIQSRDLATIKGMCTDEVKVGEENGQLTGLGHAGQMAPPPIPIEFLTPTEDASKARISFQVRPPRGLAEVSLAGPDGCTITYQIKPIKGKWMLMGVSTTANYGRAGASKGMGKGPEPAKSPQGAGKTSAAPPGAGKGGMKGPAGKGAGAIGSPVGGGSPQGAPGTAPAT